MYGPHYWQTAQNDAPEICGGLLHETPLVLYNQKLTGKLRQDILFQQDWKGIKSLLQDSKIHQPSDHRVGPNVNDGGLYKQGPTTCFALSQAGVGQITPH